MFLTSFILCEQYKPDGETASLVKPIGSFRLPFLPTMYSFVICVGIGDVGVDKATDVIIQLSDPQDSQVFNASFQIPEPEHETDALMLTVQFNNIDLKSEGIHHFKILFDGECVGQYACRVEVKS